MSFEASFTAGIVTSGGILTLKQPFKTEAEEYHSFNLMLMKGCVLKEERCVVATVKLMGWSMIR